MSEIRRGEIRHELNLHLELKVQSLITYIDSRFAILRENPEALPPGECNQLRHIQGIESIADRI